MSKTDCEELPGIRRRNALVLLPSTRFGGAESVCRQVVVELASRGWTVDVVFITGKPGEQWGGLSDRVRLIALGATRERYAGLRLLSFVLRVSVRRYDICFSSHSHTNAFLGVLRLIGLLHCNRLVSRESTRIFVRFKGLRRAAFSAMYSVGYRTQDMYVCQTRQMAIELGERVARISRGSVRALRNPCAAVEQVGRDLGSASAIIFIGKLVDLKRPVDAIEVLSMVMERIPSCSLVIIGDGPLRARLVGECVSRGLQDRVRFTGFVANVSDEIDRPFVGLVCSEVEGFPNVLLEMMSLGASVVVSTRCADGIDEIPGLEIVDVGDTRSMADRVCSALLSNSDRSSEYRQWVKDNCSIDRYVDCLLGLGPV